MTRPRPEFDAPGLIGGVQLRPAGEPPRAAVLSVGSELLLGDLTDTNATWISRRLTEHGIDVVHHLAVGDDLDELVTALRWLAARAHLVVVGGGLGPTQDDLTREAIAHAAGVPLEHHDDLEELIAARFRSTGRTMAPQNRKQARIPAGADPYPPVGTAPAFGLTLPDASPTRVVALPGVPWELHELWARHVEPELLALAGSRVTITRVLHVVGKGEADVASIVEPVIGDRDGVVLAFLAKGSETQVRLTVSASDRAAALGRSQPLVDEVSRALDGAVAGIDEEDLEAVVIRLLVEQGRTVATAESATAGDIAARLGRVPGASRALLGGVVAYASTSKHEVLGVDQALLERHGPVSAEVTDALARAARERFGADYGVAVTGVAGPEPVGDLEVGTSFWALAHPDGRVEVHGRRIPGDRLRVSLRLGSAALDLLRLRLARA